MTLVIVIVYFIGYILALLGGFYTIFFIYKNRNIYITKLTYLLLISVVFTTAFIYFSLWFFSVVFYFSTLTNLILWKLSILAGFLSLLIIILIHAFLREYKKIPVFFLLYFACIFGLIIGSLLSSESILIKTANIEQGYQIIIDLNQITYVFHPITAFLISLLQISSNIYFLITALMIYQNARNKDKSKWLILNGVILFIPFLMYVLYSFSALNVFRELHILFLLFNYTTVLFMLIKKPELFLNQTNKIYHINIYHKSGVLLYTYKFVKMEDEIESAIWGNILIGLNHILSEFVDARDQIDILQTKNSDIVVEYNNDLGFAVLVITNKKNDILKKITEKFMKEFSEKYREELKEIQDLNKIINISEFNETNRLVESNFQLYLE